MNILQLVGEKRILLLLCHTANPNPVQLTGNPCKSIPTGKTLFSLQGTPVLIAGVCFHYRDFPVNPCNFPVRDCSVEVIKSGHSLSTSQKFVFCFNDGYLILNHCHFLIYRTRIFNRGMYLLKYIQAMAAHHTSSYTYLLEKNYQSLSCQWHIKNLSCLNQGACNIHSKASNSFCRS